MDEHARQITGESPAGNDCELAPLATKDVQTLLRSAQHKALMGHYATKEQRTSEIDIPLSARVHPTSVRRLSPVSPLKAPVRNRSLGGLSPVICRACSSDRAMPRAERCRVTIRLTYSTGPRIPSCSCSGDIVYRTRGRWHSCWVVARPETGSQIFGASSN